MSHDVADGVLAGGGAMGALMRAHDWSATPLGPVETWPQSLQSALSICLGSSFPIALYWGDQLALLYNDAWSPIPGGKHPWALGRGAREVWPEIWDAIGPLFDRVTTTGQATYQEDSLLLMQRHGYTEECYFNFTFSPIRGAGGRVEGVFNAVIETTYRVISERRARVLHALAEDTATARSADEVYALAADSLANAAHDFPFCAFYQVDEETRIARLAASSGLPRGSPATPEGIALERIDGAEEADAAWPLASVYRSGRIEAVSELSNRFGLALPGGPWPEPADAALVAPINTAATGRPAGFLVVGVSPRRAIDEAYRQVAERAASNIATVVDRATAYEAERRRAERLAELDRAKTAFFSNVSHEFRTPLTLMLGPTEDALASSERALRGADLETVHRNELRLLDLVNTLLDFSRLETGRVQAAFEPTDLPTLTCNVASAFRSTVERAGLRLTVECQPLPEPVWVDHEMWEKVVLNLLSNAFKFTFTGEIAVALEWLGDRVELSVRDTGVGIPRSELSRIFERFHRVEGAKGRSFEGSGIGLALVQELVNLHGGSVRVESSEGVGTTFAVSLPTGAAHLPRGRLRASREVATTASRAESFIREASGWLDTSTEGPLDTEVETEVRAGELSAPRAAVAEERVLLADDNPDMRDYVGRLLQGRFAVEAVADGGAALEAARARPPDLVLSDVMMPKLDGFGLLRELKRDPRTAAVPVIMLSARAGEEARVGGIEAGADDYLIKPFSARELIARVSNQLRLRQFARRLERSNEELQRQALELRKLAALIDQSAEFVGITNLEGEAVFLNSAGRELVGLSQEEMSRTRIVDYLFEEDRPFVRDTLMPALFGEGRWTGEFRFRHFKTGEPIPVFWNAFTVRNEAGEPLYLATVTRDLRQQKREEAVRQRQAEFEQHLVGIVSHDLRNPLNAILLSAAGLLRRDELDERTKDTAGRIQSSAERASRLVRDLLDFTQAKLGQGIPIARKEGDLHDVFARAVDEVRSTFPEREVVFRAVGSGRGEWDGDRLAQVLHNLATNALKYSPNATPVRVVSRSVDDAVLLEVHNTGEPIAPEQFPELFKPLRRGSLEPEMRAGSIGLGLFIVDSIVRAHGGSVSVISNRKDGTTFTVRLPRGPGELRGSPSRGELVQEPR